MRVMIVNTLYYPTHVGGAEISVQILCENLIKQGHDVQVVCLHQGENREFDIVNGVNVVYLPLANFYWPYDGKERNNIKRLCWHLMDLYNFKMKSKVANEIELFKPDVVHTNNIAGFSISVFDAVKSKGVKLVHTARDYYLLHPNSTLFKNGKNIEPKSFSCQVWSFLKKNKSKKIDSFVGISNYVCELHKNNGFAKYANFQTIYNPIEPIVKNKLINKDCITIGYIGKLSDDKGFFDFCKIAEKNKDHRNIKFCAAGRASNGEQLIVKATANQYGVDLLGFIDVSSFLSLVDVVILPIKWNEPFGRTVAECALAGTTVFTNMMGGISEIAHLCVNVKPMNCFNVDSIYKLMHLSDIKYINPFEKEKLTLEYASLYATIV